MGGSGKSLRGGGARQKRNSPSAQNKDGGYGLAPHPLAVRSGQRYFPRVGRRRRLLQVEAVAGGVVRARQVDGGAKVRLSLERILAIGADGQGAHYQFAGFASRRYATYAQVVDPEVERSFAAIVLPEWHPARSVRIAARLIPDGSRHPGAWLTCTADLSQPKAAALNVADVAPSAVAPEALPDVTFRPAEERAARPRPDAGPGCGDVVLELPGADLAGASRRGGLVDLFVPERPRDLRDGDRVYLWRDGAIEAYVELAHVETRPNGAVLRCRPDPLPLRHSVPADARAEQGHWVWRWWTRAAEQAGGERLRAEAATYDPEEHAPDFKWTLRPA
jgi:hypothetical protein